MPIVRRGYRVHAAATNRLVVGVCAGHRPCPASGRRISLHLAAPPPPSLAPTVREDSPGVDSHAAAVRHSLGTRRRAPTMSGGLLRQAGRRPRAHLLVPGFRKALTGRVGVGRNGQCAPPACQARSQAPPGPLKGAGRSRYHATSRHSERCAVPGVGLSAVPASRNVPDFSLYKNRRRIAATWGMLTDCDTLCTFCAKLERSLMFARSARGKPG